LSDRPLRLGDVIDDYCPHCRLLLNHDVASLVGGTVSKSTCRTCFNTHDYRHGQAPARRPRKKDDKQSLIEQVLGNLPAPPPPAPPPVAPPAPRRKRDLWAEVERLRRK
jgi:hypothetical protein